MGQVIMFPRYHCRVISAVVKAAGAEPSVGETYLQFLERMLKQRKVRALSEEYRAAREAGLPVRLKPSDDAA